MSPAFVTDAILVRDVWAPNFDVEMSAFIAAASVAGPAGFLAMDMEFPGFLRQEPVFASSSNQYRAMRGNVDVLRPVQVGMAIARGSGELLGAWSFNLHFNVAEDHHSEVAIAFLASAGIDFPRHAAEGIGRSRFSEALAACSLVGTPQGPLLTTFAGLYDLGYLVNLLTQQSLPCNLSTFESVLCSVCPHRCELRDWLPHGSLDVLAREHGVCRQGAAHTAGSDALVTLELLLRVQPVCAVVASEPTPSNAQFGESACETGDAFQRHLETTEAAWAQTDALILRLKEAAGHGRVRNAASEAKSAWGAAARWAMHGARGCNEGVSAPSTMWAAAAQDAAMVRSCGKIRQFRS